MINQLVTFLIASLPLLPQQHLIEWNAARKLTWADFKAAPKASSTYAALTSSSINIEFGYDDNSLQYTIKCRFDKTRSWVRVKTVSVLLHEQGHFDIAELHARKLNKALKEYVFNPASVSDDVNKIYDQLMAAHHEFQDRYDQETNFSRNKEKQEWWGKKIVADLKALQAYAGYQQKQAKSNK